MSNPAIVLLTDPAQCGLGDVHHLVEALLEIQQMGEHAAPQAFCDHPAAAREFMTAYAEAYPKLVLESQAIPTPDHLQSLMINGQIGPLAQPQAMASLDEAWRPPEQNGLNAFPLVVLTLGQSQALLDVLEQNQLIKKGISLIDIAPDAPGDSMPVSIAEAVATRDRGIEGLWEDAGASGGRLELDEVARAATPEASDPMLRDDQISLDTVEPVDPPSAAPPTYYGELERQPEAPPASPPAPPEPTGQAEPSRAQESAETKPAAELTEAAAQAPVNGGWPASSTPTPGETVPTEAASDGTVSGGTVPDDADDGATDDGDEPPDDDEETKAPPEDDMAQDVEGDDKPLAAGHAAARDDDVHYPPVGTLTADADVHYPAADDADAPATLWELAAAISDEGILDTDLPSDMLSSSDEDRALESSDLRPAVPHASRHEPDTVEELYDSADSDSDDAGSDADLSHPMHDSDL